MKSWIPYVLPMSCILLMSGLGAWYFYSKFSVILEVSRHEQRENPLIQAPIAVQAGSSSDHVVEKLKSFFGDAKKVVPKASKEREKPEASIALHGVLMGSGERKAAAIMSLDGGKQRIYYAGDLLADGLKLVSVQDQEVLVTGADGLKSVRLERSSGGGQDTPPTDHIAQSPSIKEGEEKERSRIPSRVVQGGAGTQTDISEKLNRLKSLARGEQK